jgi:hypothetical protein
MPDMVYADTTDQALASVQIRPTWFDPSLQIGRTKLQVAIHLPAGVTADEVKYQDEQQRYAELATFGDDKHVVAIWESANHQLSKNNPKFSLSFPRRVMQRVVEKSTLDLFLEWFDHNKPLQLASGCGLVGALALLFFRFSNGTGCVVFLMLLALLLGLVLAGPGLHLLCWPIVLALIGVNEWYLRNHRKRASYLPAMATVEGGGIKRGLTAPQAAVLLEMPLPKVLTLVLLGLLKKRVLQLLSNDPPAVEVADQFRCLRQQRLERAAQIGIVLHDYEHSFLDRLQAHTGPVEKCDLNEAMGILIQSVVDRMKGFDRQRTCEYYQRIIQRAWKEAQKIGEIKQRDQVVERNFEWMMMDPDWVIVFDDWNRRGYDYRPVWSRPMPSAGSGGPAPSPSTGGGGSSPTLTEVAGSFAGWAENTAGSFAGMLEPAAMGLDVPGRGGVLDLSGIDKVTSDVFEALAEASKSKGGGGGGSGGCACACAGCACACACAGGGR